MKAFLLVVLVSCQQLMCDLQLELKDQLVEYTDELVEHTDKLAEHMDKLVEYTDELVEYTDKLVKTDELVEFTAPEQVKATDSEITLGLTLLNIKRVKSIAELFQVKIHSFKNQTNLSVIHQEQVDDFILSLFLHSSGEPIRMVVITDQHSLPGLCILSCVYISEPTADVNTLLVNSKSKVLTKGVALVMRDRNFSIPRLSLVFVDIEKLIEGEEKVIQELKSNAEQGLEVKIYFLKRKLKKKHI